jgi:hypothetical protein
VSAFPLLAQLRDSSPLKITRVEPYLVRIGDRTAYPLARVETADPSPLPSLALPRIAPCGTEPSSCDCRECRELDNIRLDKIKRYTDLVEKQRSAKLSGNTWTPELDASVLAAETDIIEAWQRLGEHRKSHESHEGNPGIGISSR